MGKKLKLLAEGGALIGAPVAGGAFYLAHQIAYPHTHTLEEEKKWEKDHGTWGDYDKLPHTYYTVAGKDGYILHCEYVETNPGSKKFVILTHGYTSNRYASVKYVGVYARLGFNCVLYDCRGHGENEPTPCSLGNLESQDLRFIIFDTYNRFGNDIEIGLHGESMGASTSLCVLRFNPKIRFVVADSSFTNLYTLIKDIYQEKHIAFMMRPVNFMTRKIYHFNMKKTNPKGALRGNQVPICLIHGEEDSLIPSKHSDDLAITAFGYIELHKVEGADHVQSRQVLGEEKYAEIVGSFLEKSTKVMESIRRH